MTSTPWREMERAVRGRRSWFWWVLLVLLLAAPALHAQTAEERQAAIEIVKDANELYDGGRFREALPLYRQAYHRLNDPRLLYRIGLTYEHLGNFRRGREFLEAYLAEDPDSRYAGRIEAKVEQLRKLEESVQSYLRVDSEPAGAKVFIDGFFDEPEGVTPLEIPVGAGEHTVVLVFPDRRKLEEVVAVEANEMVERRYRLGTDESLTVVEEAPAPEPEVPAPRETPVVTATPSVDSLTFVDLGPPNWAIVTGWTAVLVGNAFFVAGLILSSVDNGGGGTMIGGGLLTAGGIYLLGVHNWASPLPPARAAMPLMPASDVVTRIGFRWAF